jgi:hypothetical protein
MIFEWHIYEIKKILLYIILRCNIFWGHVRIKTILMLTCKSWSNKNIFLKWPIIFSHIKRLVNPLLIIHPKWALLACNIKITPQYNKYSQNFLVASYKFTNMSSRDVWKMKIRAKCPSKHSSTPTMF